MINDMGLVTPLKIACGYKGEKKPIINKQHFATGKIATCSLIIFYYII